MVRAGEGAVAAADFQAKSVVAIGWYRVDWTKFANGRAIQAKLAECAPGKSPRQLIAAASQIERFLRHIEIEDSVVSYDGHRRLFFLGVIKGAPMHSTDVIQDFPTYRAVKWQGTASRDKQSLRVRKALGAISTLYLVADWAAAEIKAHCDPL